MDRRAICCMDLLHVGVLLLRSSPYFLYGCQNEYKKLRRKEEHEGLTACRYAPYVI